MIRVRGSNRLQKKGRALGAEHCPPITPTCVTIVNEYLLLSSSFSSRPIRKPLLAKES